jgi:hypothetical protein
MPLLFQIPSSSVLVVVCVILGGCGRGRGKLMKLFNELPRSPAASPCLFSVRLLRITRSELNYSLKNINGLRQSKGSDLQKKNLQRIGVTNSL